MFVIIKMEPGEAQLYGYSPEGESELLTVTYLPFAIALFFALYRDRDEHRWEQVKLVDEKSQCLYHWDRHHGMINPEPYYKTN